MGLSSLVFCAGLWPRIWPRRGTMAGKKRKDRRPWTDALDELTEARVRRAFHEFATLGDAWLRRGTTSAGSLRQATEHDAHLGRHLLAAVEAVEAARTAVASEAVTTARLKLVGRLEAAFKMHAASQRPSIRPEPPPPSKWSSGARQGVQMELEADVRQAWVEYLHQSPDRADHLETDEESGFSEDTYGEAVQLGLRRMGATSSGVKTARGAHKQGPVEAAFATAAFLLDLQGPPREGGVVDNPGEARFSGRGLRLAFDRHLSARRKSPAGPYDNSPGFGARVDTRSPVALVAAAFGGTTSDVESLKHWNEFGASLARRREDAAKTTATPPTKRGETG